MYSLIVTQIKRINQELLCGEKDTTLNLREKEQSVSAEATLRWSLETSLTVTLPQQSALLFLQAHVEANASPSIAFLT